MLHIVPLEPKTRTVYILCVHIYACVLRYAHISMRVQQRLCELYCFEEGKWTIELCGQPLLTVCSL